MIDTNQIDVTPSLQQYIFSHKPYNWIKQQTKQKLTFPEPPRTKQNMLNIGTKLCNETVLALLFKLMSNSIGSLNRCM